MSEEKFRSLKEHLKRFEEENNGGGEEKDERSIPSSSSASSSSSKMTTRRRDEEEDEISPAGNARRRRRRNSSRKSSNRSEERRDGKHHRRAPQTSSSSKSRRKKYRFPLASLIDFRKLGRHKRYADLTMSRPLMRGWLHCLLASVGYPILLYNNKSEWFRMHPRTFWLLMCTLVPYTCSTFLHFIPWKSRFAHDVALSADFLGISFGFTSHGVILRGFISRHRSARRCMRDVDSFLHANPRVSPKASVRYEIHHEESGSSFSRSTSSC